jgi:hypothetical protein
MAKKIKEDNTAKTEDPILERLRSKAAIKQLVYQNTSKVFEDLKRLAADFAVTYHKEARKIDKNISIAFEDKGEFEGHLKVAADMLFFTMHSNIFEFPKNHPIMRSSYIKFDPMRSYCGVIYIYNFLADSFKFGRTNDLGYLVARIFVNNEFHFVVEGKRQVEFLTNNALEQKITEDCLKKILQTAIMYCLDFDLLLTPYDEIKQVTVADMMEYAQNMNVRTGKRLGFRFQADPDEQLMQ